MQESPASDQTGKQPTIDFLDFIDLVKEVLGPKFPRTIKSKLKKSVILRGIANLPQDTGDLLLEAVRRCYLRLFKNALSTDLPEGYKKFNDDGLYITGDAITDSANINYMTDMDQEGIIIPIRIFFPKSCTVWFYTPEEIIEEIHRRLSFAQAKVTIVNFEEESPIESRQIVWDVEISHGFPKDYNLSEFSVEQMRSIFCQLLLADAFRPQGPISKYPDVLAFFMIYENLYRDYYEMLEKAKESKNTFSEKKKKGEITSQKYREQIDRWERNLKFKITALFDTYFADQDLKFQFTIVPTWTCSHCGQENKLNHDIEYVDLIDYSIIRVFSGVDEKNVPQCETCNKPKKPNNEGPGGLLNDGWKLSGSPTNFRISRKFFFL